MRPNPHAPAAAQVARVVARYFEVLNGADPERLRDLLTDDFCDEDPLAGALGVDGVIKRVRLYRLAIPDAHSVVEAVIPHEEGATVVWVTTTADLDGAAERASYRYTAELTMRGPQIRSHHVVSVVPIHPCLAASA